MVGFFINPIFFLILTHSKYLKLMLKNLYFLGIIPPAEIASDITLMKQFCADNFNCRHALNAPPHITLLPPFRVDTTVLHKLDALLAQTTKSFAPFFIELNGFDHFSNRVVFVAIENNKSLDNIQQHCAKAITGMLPQDEPDKARFHAHVTIAFKDIDPQKFESIWNQEQASTVCSNAIHFSY